jgi:hypothetical protein
MGDYAATFVILRKSYETPPDPVAVESLRECHGARIIAVGTGKDEVRKLCDGSHYGNNID